MKTLALILTFCISFNVLATEPVIDELESLIDDYNYALTVEWDQKDAKFAAQKTTQFYSELERLLTNGELSKDQLDSLLASKVSDQRKLQSLKERAALLPSFSTSQELGNYLATNKAEFYASGASWNGTATVFYGGLALFFLSFIAYTTWYNSNYECVEWELRTHNVCVRYEKKQ